MEVQILSKEYIKPSSPTPPHINTYRFSLLDHVMPPVYVPMVMFYPPVSPLNTTRSERSQALKQSLSETLTRFYPLAGRIRDYLCIHCNDEGACYIEADVKSHDLSEFLQHPDLSVLPKLLPTFNSLLDYTDLISNATTGLGGEGGADVVMIQVTNFACGGFVIGVFVSHMIVDGIAISNFLKAWAAATAHSLSGQSVHELPDFDAATLFPPILDEQGKRTHPREATMRGLYRRFAKRGRCVTNRFVFEASAVAKLKEQAATSSLQNPSRVEAVSAFIWKCATAAWKAKSGQSAPSLITHAVNLRRRAEPNFSQNCMGNFVCLAGAIANGHQREQELELSSLVSKMREATSKFNGDLVAKLQGQDGLATISKVFQDMAEAITLSTNGDDQVEMNFIGYTSIAYSGVYDADFGWGKPLWVVPVHEPCHEAFSVNVVRLMDTGEWGNNGFEAWISLAEEEMAMLQINQDLLAFATLNPSPLRLSQNIGS
ncbi:putative vinorine synthase [Rosa chinensis]|uniref:Putative vinorine synthase n=1 Tax=Rosa chinensis TaxID=74649 RepID=A0A2P6PZH6_ROSCH|nr:stemmadenine O-acetyltransferase [Rosa chinensis]PRQ27334.1 putative vinorine synthase [Rosa chinensis]